MAQNSDHSDEEGLSTLDKTAQWCQQKQYADAESKRTELYELPYHYWDALSRPPNPDIGLASASRVTGVVNTTPASAGRSLTPMTSQQTPIPVTHRDR